MTDRREHRELVQRSSTGAATLPPGAGLVASPYPLDWCVGLALGHEPDAPRIVHNLTLRPAPRPPAQERDDPMGEHAPIRVIGQAMPALERMVVAGAVLPFTMCYPGPMTDRFEAFVMLVLCEPVHSHLSMATIDLLITSPTQRRW